MIRAWWPFVAILVLCTIVILAALRAERELEAAAAEDEIAREMAEVR